MKPIPKKWPSNLQELDSTNHSEITPWEEAIPWETLAKDRIDKHKKAGIALRGARFRESMSQVKLAKLSGVHQNEISKIENGKRNVGKKSRKKTS